MPSHRAAFKSGLSVDLQLDEEAGVITLGPGEANDKPQLLGNLLGNISTALAKHPDVTVELLGDAQARTGALLQPKAGHEDKLAATYDRLLKQLEKIGAAVTLHETAPAAESEEALAARMLSELPSGEAVPPVADAGAQGQPQDKAPAAQEDSGPKQGDGDSAGHAALILKKFEKARREASKPKPDDKKKGWFGR